MVPYNINICIYDIDYNVALETCKELVAHDGRFVDPRIQRQKIRSDTHQFLELEDGILILHVQRTSLKNSTIKSIVYIFQFRRIVRFHRDQL